MKIGVFSPPGMPESFRVCVENIASRLGDHGCSVSFSDNAGELARADVAWDPRAGGGCPPHDTVLGLDVPIVVTLHGVAPLAIPFSYEKGLLGRLSLLGSNAAKKKAWRAAHTRCDRIVTVSHFSKATIIEHLKIPPAKIEVAYNGVDHDLFKREGRGFDALPDLRRPYFLHISNDEPRKNVDGLLKAYSRLDAGARWPLVLKLSSRRDPKIAGVIRLAQRLTDNQIAALYRDAGAFVFPSFYEGFGLPIIEAMASGCPVITADGNACAEVAGRAAKLVNPGSVSELAAAMRFMMEAGSLESLVAAGLERARHFSWQSTAESYARVFREVVERDPAARYAT